MKFSLFLALVFLYACSSSKQDEDIQKIPIKAIKARVNSNSSLIQSLEASGIISFDSPENSGTGDIEIKIKKPDSVYVKIGGPFGISIAVALITRKDFVYYNVQENKVIMGPSTELNIGAILRIKVSFDELINSFTGSFHFQDESVDSTAAESQNNLYVLQVNNSYGVEEYFIEPDKFTIQRYDMLDKDFKSRIEVGYSNYSSESSNGKEINFPNKIVIRNPEKKQSVYLDYDSKDINNPDISITMKFPKSAKVVKWD